MISYLHYLHTTEPEQACDKHKHKHIKSPRLLLIPPHLLHLRQILLRLLPAAPVLLSQGLVRVLERLDQSLPQRLRHPAGRAADEHGTVLVVQQAEEQGVVLADAVLDVDLLPLVAGEGCQDREVNGLGEAGPLVLVEEVGVAVAVAEEEDGWADWGLSAWVLLAVCFREGGFLPDHGPQGCDSRPGADQDRGAGELLQGRAEAAFQVLDFQGTSRAEDREVPRADALADPLDDGLVPDDGNEKFESRLPVRRPLQFAAARDAELS